MPWWTQENHPARVAAARAAVTLLPYRPGLWIGDEIDTPAGPVRLTSWQGWENGRNVDPSLPDFPTDLTPVHGVILLGVAAEGYTHAVPLPRSDYEVRMLVGNLARYADLIVSAGDGI